MGYNDLMRPRISLKLILIMIFLIIALGFVGGYIYFEKNLSAERFFQSSRFREGIFQYLGELSAPDKNGFKLTKESPEVSIRASFYALTIYKRFLGKNLVKLTNLNPDAMLDKIRSYYVSPGYYLEEDEEPIFSTVKVLSIDFQFSQDLNQEINLDWLKKNSLENENLENNKLDPEYQLAVINIYRLLGLPEKVEEISVPYLNYYCYQYKPDESSDQSFLRTKFYQISLISNLSGVLSNQNSCLIKEDTEVAKERLGKILFGQLTNIKEIFFLCHLKVFYGLLKDSDLEKSLKAIKEFYSEYGFRENLNDQSPNLTGTYYAIKFLFQFHPFYIL